MKQYIISQPPAPYCLFLLTIKAIAEFDAYNRFQVMASKGDIQQGLALLDKLDASF